MMKNNFTRWDPAKFLQEAEEEVEKLKIDLEQRIIERTEELRISETKYLNLFTSITDGIVQTDLDGKFLDCNHAYLSLTGYSKDELKNIDLRKITPEKWFQMEKEIILTQTLPRGYSDEYEKEYIRKDKKIIPISVKVWTVSDSVGKPLYFCAIFRDNTERKTVEQSLKASEERFRKLVESITDYLYSVEVRDGKPKATSHGQGCLAVTGYTAEEFAADIKLWYNIISEQDREIVSEHIDKLLSGEKVKPIEHRIVHKNGSIRWIRNTAVPRFDIKGNLVSFDGLISDITIRKRIEEALRKSEEKFRLVAYFTYDWEYWIDINGKYLYISPSCQRITGYPPQMIIKNPEFLIDIVHPDDKKIAKQHFFDYSDRKNETELFLRIITKEGKICWISHFCQSVYSNDGSYLGRRGCNRDITDRKLAEDALKLANSYNRSLIEASLDPLVTISHDGRITDANSAIEVITGYTQEELIGTDFSDYFTEPDKARIGYQQVFREGFVRDYMLEICHKDGHITPVLYNASLYRDLNGTIMGIFAAARDITGRKIAEEELKKVNETLEYRVEERTKQLDMLINKLQSEILERHQIELQLQKAKDEAENANKSKSEFLANMSHEIRTPMNGVLGMTELLMHTELTKHQQNYAELIRSSAQSLLDIINDILNFSKIEAGKIEVSSKPFSLNELIELTIKSLAPIAHKKNLELIYHIHENVFDNLIGDELLLKQILINLIGNAIKYTENGEVFLNVERISPHEITDSELPVYLHFTIRDTGIGIPEDKQKIIFNPFTQAGLSFSKKYGGTGLGLSICTNLIRLMKGKIWVESDVNKGSTFHFTAGFNIRGSKAQLKSFFLPESQQGLNVLIVDDNITNQKILVELFTNWKLNPIAVTNGKKAISEIKKMTALKSHFSFIFLDTGLVDEEYFFKSLIQINLHADYIIILMTTLDKPFSVTLLKEFNIIDQSAFKSNTKLPFSFEKITKPLTISELKELFQNLFNLSNKTIELKREQKTEKDFVSMNILLAEDNPINRELVTGILEMRDYNVITAENGREAVSAFKKGNFDFILMDVQMPEMDGFSATKEIRKLGNKGKQVPIVALTAHVLEGFKEQCLSVGMDDYLSKPFKFETLFGMIDKLIVGQENPKKNIKKTSQRLKKDASRKDKIDKKRNYFPIDPAAAKKLCGGIKRIFVDQIRIFNVNKNILLVELESALESQDGEKIREKAHKFKGGMQNIGATRAAEIAYELEIAGKNDKLTKTGEIFEELRKEITKISEFFDNKKLVDEFIKQIEGK